MKFLRGPVCGIAEAGSARRAMAATWKMRAKTAPVAREDTLGTLSAWATRTKPATIAQGWPAPPAPAQADKEDGAASICALAWSSPRRPGAIESAQRLAASASSSRRAEDGERRETSCLWPTRGASSGRRAPLKFTSCICKSSGETRDAEATLASPIARVGGRMFPSPCFDAVWVMKRSPAPKPRHCRQHLLSPVSGFSARVLFLQVSTIESACGARPLPASPKAARPVNAG